MFSLPDCRPRLLPQVLVILLCGPDVGCSKRPDLETPAAAPGTTNADTTAVQHMLDLPYEPPAGVVATQATLDLSWVDDGRARPLVVLVHGGSWAGGDKANFARKITPWFLERGYVTAAVNFRLATRWGESPTVKPVDQAHDIAAALSWLLDHGDAYRIARSGTVLLGYSSGAHLVALLGTDERFVEQAGLDPDQIAAAISLDVHAYDVPFALEMMPGSVVEQNMHTIRHLFGDTEQAQLLGSPIHHTDGWAAPALVVSVGEDPSVVGTHGYIVSQAANRYVTALTAAGHHAVAMHDRQKSHASLVGEFGDPGDSITESIESFLSEMERVHPPPVSRATGPPPGP